MTARARSQRAQHGLFPAVLLFLLAGCSASRPAGPEISVEDPWARAVSVLTDPKAGGVNSAVYLLLRNQGREEDRLLGGETPVAEGVEVHETRTEGDVARMRRVDGVTLPPNSAVELSPGGLHIMLIGLRRTLREGDEFDLTLIFQESPDLLVSVPVGPLRGS